MIFYSLRYAEQFEFADLLHYFMVFSIILGIESGSSLLLGLIKPMNVKRSFSVLSISSFFEKTLNFLNENILYTFLEIFQFCKNFNSVLLKSL